MRPYPRIADRVRLTVVVLSALILGVGGCSLQPATRNSLAGVGLAVASQTPTSSLEQVYYLGVFDPQDQLPPTIYRVRVRAQGSALNLTRYASGWVRAELIDSLSTVARFDSKDPDAGIKVSAADDESRTMLTGRRLILFGPEGFREAPKDHRLVVVMGSSPEKFFNAVDEALGVVAAVTQGQSGDQLERTLFRELLRLKLERERLNDLRSDATSAGGGQ